MSREPKDEPEVIPLPVRRPSTDGATRFQILWWRLREWLGRGANAVGLPGAVAETDYIDDLTGQRLRVRVGPLFVTVQVNGRDHYFWRFSGQHDGSGSALRPDV